MITTMPPIPIMIIFALAVTRLSTLITMDEISYPIRRAIARRLNGARRSHRMLVYLFGSIDDDYTDGCPWCMSVWIGMIGSAVCWYQHTNPVVMAIAIGLAFSQVTGMIAKVGRG